MERLLGWVGLPILALMLAPQAATAQLSSRPAEEWIPRLERHERVSELRVNEVVQKLGLKPGDKVADIGAGAGVFSWPLARAVAPGGTVYAVEIDKGFTAYLEKRAKEQQIDNVKPVLGQFEDPLLPEQVDMAFFHDVLHHVDKRPAYLKTLAGYVKPGGRVVVIDMDATLPDASHKDEPELQVTKEEANSWMADAGFELVEDVPMFKDKWFVVYRKSAGGR
jgi:ubiquinone/menaquinone biosynthesis C-methylase UbiE